MSFHHDHFLLFLYFFFAFELKIQFQMPSFITRIHYLTNDIKNLRDRSRTKEQMLGHVIEAHAIYISLQSKMVLSRHNISTLRRTRQNTKKRNTSVALILLFSSLKNRAYRYRPWNCRKRHPSLVSSSISFSLLTAQYRREEQDWPWL